jgi:hypothetical protein
MADMLLAYDADGAVIATLDFMVTRDDQGQVTGLVDFAAHAQAGGHLREIWEVDRAVRSAVSRKTSRTRPDGPGGAKGLLAACQDVHENLAEN